ncbi:glycosyltransferase involved in cell wall biosynthesis [Kitasatospora sp. MAP12-15]|uniref:glycosyltransferase family 2 protein n=1 Tax=unclassified Kitasatospora TaxID=2633591 RepID=UPI002475A50B|nr:glycosyltransferase [Kitasatospora sp. MAP12-44]MDH6113859.1 glycosyltransferase involved in cell wall biosynthesis [Kitasatospora sp. MAP12-44]
MPEPLISVVLPAHDQQGQLSSCLDSILDQSFGGFEVIVVTDPSPHCASELSQAVDEPRVTVLRLNAAVGVGHSRNAGAAHANGRYLLFLDSDHLVAPGAFLTLADRLRELEDSSAEPEARQPDVLLFGHTRLQAGRIWPGAASALLAQAGPDAFGLSDHPELLSAPAFAWDRLISRGLWSAASLAFPEGRYEEVPLVHHAMLTADRLAVLDRELVQLRRRETVHPAGSPGSSHFDIFDQYERSFALLDARSEKSLHSALFIRMIRHYLFVFDLAGCVPRAVRPQFFHRAAEHYQRWVPDGFKRPGGREGVKFSLLAGGSYGAFELAKLSQIARTAVTSRAGRRTDVA